MKISSTGGEIHIPNPTLLEWDSAFFGFPVYRLNVSNDCDIAFAISELRRIASPNSVAYIFTDGVSDKKTSEALSAEGAVHYGSRVCYTQRLLDKSPIINCNGINSLTDFTNEEKDLAIASGRFSRFAKDPHFNAHYRNLYSVWMENGFVAKKKGKGEIYGYRDSGTLAGIVSVTCDGVDGKIELLAVAEAHRRKGIGRKLVASAIMFAKMKGCKTLSVATQGDNAPACGLYTSCGFVEVERSETWHMTL